MKPPFPSRLETVSRNRFIEALDELEMLAAVASYRAEWGLTVNPDGAVAETVDLADLITGRETNTPSRFRP